MKIKEPERYSCPIREITDPESAMTSVHGGKTPGLFPGGGEYLPLDLFT